MTRNYFRRRTLVTSTDTRHTGALRKGTSVALLTYGSLEDLVPAPGEAVAEDTRTLPGLALSSVTVTDTRELFRGKAEMYLFGVALDSSGEVRIVPFGVAEIEKHTHALAVRRVGKGESVRYLGQGMPLVPPPVKDFLFLRLLVIDSDAGIRSVAPLLKASGEIAGSKEAIALLVAAGMPHAAAVAAVVGKATEGIAAALEKNRDDLIALFQGYFALSDTGADITAEEPGAKIVLHWVRD